MAKKKKQQSADKLQDPQSPTSAWDNQAGQSKSDSTSKRTAETVASSSSGTGSGAGAAAQEPALIICRNKHWRYISSFHGHWLQLPLEILETLAHANFNAIHPLPIDPAVFYDVYKIRRLVDEATDLTVRAASGIPLSGSPNSHAHLYGLNAAPPRSKLSPERKHRMREQATQKLAHAYMLDEIATSVATMQGASTLEDVASLVLHRSKDDPDAKYVYFFHEKIPSRQLAECTSLEQLDDVIRRRPTNPEHRRTRATIRIFKQEYIGAAQDLSMALQFYQTYHPSRHIHVHGAGSTTDTYEVHGGTAGPAEVNPLEGRRQVENPTEAEQPSSLEGQLLFQRGGVYLTLACLEVMKALPSDDDKSKALVSTKPGAPVPPEEPPPAPTATQLEAMKAVKNYAKRGLRDYLAFLSRLEYSPNFPLSEYEEYNKKISHLKNGLRRPPPTSATGSSTSPTSSTLAEKIILYKVSDLFTATPPSNLPAFGVQDTLQPPLPATSSPSASSSTTTATTSPPAPIPHGHSPEIEVITYHPLLIETLHSLLLLHALIQTSMKELSRHANMVARLSGLADGFPVFQASRSPARADWNEVMRYVHKRVGVAAPKGASTNRARPNAMTVGVPVKEIMKENVALSGKTVVGGKGKGGGDGGAAASKTPIMEAHLAAVSLPKSTASAAEKPADTTQTSQSVTVLEKSISTTSSSVSISESTISAATNGETVPEAGDDVSPPPYVAAPSTSATPTLTTTVATITASTGSKTKLTPIQATIATTTTGTTSSAESSSGVLNTTTNTVLMGHSATVLPRLPRLLEDVASKEYSIVTERAAAVSRWMVEAPRVGAGGKRKKKGGKGGKGAKGKKSERSTGDGNGVGEGGGDGGENKEAGEVVGRRL